jgi:radical SAM protein with 4Fe4S-binding SPASM domain
MPWGPPHILIITKTVLRCYNNPMSYRLSRRASLKWLETPAVYHVAKDELYELDDESFRFMRNCVNDEGCESKDSAFIDYCMDEGILTTEPFVRRHPVVVQAPTPSLRYLELQITNACNLRCKHCYIDDKNRYDLSLEQIGKILSEFEEMQGLRVMISGGEPLLHPRFEEINEKLAEFFVRKVLFTNGVLLSKERLKSLKVDEIQVSIDGLEAAHDALRGSGMFDRSMRAIDLALDAGFDVSVSTMVHRKNLTDFDALERQFRRMGIKDWTVDVPCSTGRMRDYRELLVGPEEGGTYLGYGFGGGLHAAAQGFGCGLHLMAVTAAGKTAKCTFYGDHPVGTIDESLRSSWRKLQPISLKDLLGCRCEYVEVCRGGCRYRAELVEGKGGRDLYRCRLYGII